MNILILVRDYKSGILKAKNGMPEKSGAEIHVERHAEALKKIGHQVTIMAKKRKSTTKTVEIINGIKLIRLISGLRMLTCMLYLLMNRKKVDVLYVFGQPSFNLVSIAVAKYLNIPAVYVSTMTGEAFEKIKSDKYFGGYQPYRKFHDYILKKCSAFIAISQEIADEFVEHGLSAAKIHVMPQGVNIAEFKPLSTAAKIAQKEKLGLPADKTIVLFCSRLDFRKGVDLLLNAWPDVHQQVPQAYLVVVGGGIKEYVAQVTAMCNQDHAGCYIGEVDTPQIYFQCADVFIFPSRREGCPNVLMEAMACGCAPVVSKIGGCVDLVVNDKNGIVFEKENETSFKNSLVALLKQPEKIAVLAQESLNKCVKELDVHVVASKLNDLFLKQRER